mmetsp:Transcript_26226/g.56836  ORF Transcript_26226/g.56836 Transcript_26226/m.56836 type:complete len:223 (+) Transcript_26226:1452-2120(+)
MEAMRPRPCSCPRLSLSLSSHRRFSRRRSRNVRVKGALRYRTRSDGNSARRGAVATPVRSPVGRAAVVVMAVVAMAVVAMVAVVAMAVVALASVAGMAAEGRAPSVHEGLDGLSPLHFRDGLVGEDCLDGLPSLLLLHFRHRTPPLLFRRRRGRAPCPDVLHGSGALMLLVLLLVLLLLLLLLVLLVLPRKRLLRWILTPACVFVVPFRGRMVLNVLLPPHR